MRPSLIALIMILTVIIIWLFLALPIVYFAGVSGESGRVGDTFGIITSFFSALGFGGLAYTLYQQNKILLQQEIEIERQRLETKIDRFESKFFQILAAQREIVNELDLKKSSSKAANRIVTVKGRECFKVMYNQGFKDELRKYYKEKKDKELPREADLYKLFHLKELITVFEHKLFPRYQGDLTHYFRHLYQIVKLIDNADFLVDKSDYVGIVRAQLSMHEMLLLFYNGLTIRGKKFKILIERYGLLKGISDGYLINGSEDMWSEPTYNASAFGKGNPLNKKREKLFVLDKIISKY